MNWRIFRSASVAPLDRGPISHTVGSWSHQSHRWIVVPSVTPLDRGPIRHWFWWLCNYSLHNLQSRPFGLCCPTPIKSLCISWKSYRHWEQRPWYEWCSSNSSNMVKVHQWSSNWMESAIDILGGQKSAAPFPRTRLSALNRNLGRLFQYPLNTIRLRHLPSLTIQV